MLSRVTSVGLFAALGTRCAELARAPGGGDHGVDEGTPHTRRLERAQPRSGGSARRRHRGPQGLGAFVSLCQQRRRPKQGLVDELGGDRPRQPDEHPGLRRAPRRRGRDTQDPIPTGRSPRRGGVRAAARRGPASRAVARRDRGGRRWRGSPRRWPPRRARSWRACSASPSPRAVRAPRPRAPRSSRPRRSTAPTPLHRAPHPPRRAPRRHPPASGTPRPRRRRPRPTRRWAPPGRRGSGSRAPGDDRHRPRRWRDRRRRSRLRGVRRRTRRPSSRRRAAPRESRSEANATFSCTVTPVASVALTVAYACVPPSCPALVTSVASAHGDANGPEEPRHSAVLPRTTEAAAPRASQHRIGP